MIYIIIIMSKIWITNKKYSTEFVKVFLFP